MKTMSYKQKNNTHHTKFWDNRRNKITSSIGGWQGGKDVISHGYSLIHELLGKVTYMQMIILNITGRLVDKKLADWFEGNFIGLSYPDARIWCNQIGALAGTMRTSPVAATVAGILGTDSRAYGGSQTSLIGMLYIQQALEQTKQGMNIQQLIEHSPYKDNHPVINGFARPVKKKDERIEAYEKMTKQLGFKVGAHLSLAYEIGEYLEKHYDLGMNSGGYSCAFYADQGFTAMEIYQIKAVAAASGIMASFVDNKEQPANTFLPLRCNDILYEGVAPRKLPA
jgi:hypothetical protein